MAVVVEVSLVPRNGGAPDTVVVEVTVLVEDVELVDTEVGPHRLLEEHTRPEGQQPPPRLIGQAVKLELHARLVCVLAVVLV
jgi:hypothetical protein